MRMDQIWPGHQGGYFNPAQLYPSCAQLRVESNSNTKFPEAQGILIPQNYDLYSPGTYTDAITASQFVDVSRPRNEHVRGNARWSAGRRRLAIPWRSTVDWGGSRRRQAHGLKSFAFVWPHVRSSWQTCRSPMCWFDLPFVP